MGSALASLACIRQVANESFIHAATLVACNRSGAAERVLRFMPADARGMLC